MGVLTGVNARLKDVMQFLTSGRDLLAVLHPLFRPMTLAATGTAGGTGTLPEDDRQKRLPACPADLRVFAPGARNRACVCRMRILFVPAGDATMDAHCPGR